MTAAPAATAAPELLATAAEVATLSEVATVGYALLLAGLLVLSGSFSGSEAVLFSLTPTQVQHDAHATSLPRRWVARAMTRPERTLNVILVANTAVNVLLFSTSYVFFQRLSATHGDWVAPLSAVFSVLMVIVFGEVVPKIVGVGLAYQLAPFSATLVRVAEVATGPIGPAVDWLLVRPISRILFGNKPLTREPHEITAEELKTLLEMNRRTGHIDANEDQMLREVVNLGYNRVRDVMTPRVEMRAFDISEPAAALYALMRDTRLRKVPVYEGSIDNIIGLIYAKVLFFNPNKSLRELLTPIHFVPEIITCEQVLQHFRRTNSQLAVAVDEFGGVAGLVTLEDVLEAVVGDIAEPHEADDEPELAAVTPGTYDVSGAMSVRYWAEAFGMAELPARVATVGGLVMTRLGRPARVGDVVREANVELRVLAVQQRRVLRLRVRLLPQEAETEATPV